MGCPRGCALVRVDEKADYTLRGGPTVILLTAAFQAAEVRGQM